MNPQDKFEALINTLTEQIKMISVQINNLSGVTNSIFDDTTGIKSQLVELTANISELQNRISLLEAEQYKTNQKLEGRDKKEDGDNTIPLTKLVMVLLVLVWLLNYMTQEEIKNEMDRILRRLCLT